MVWAQNFVEEPTMTREQAVEAFETGIRLVKEKIDEGFNCFLSRGNGHFNTTASALMTAKFAGLTAEESWGEALIFLMSV